MLFIDYQSLPVRQYYVWFGVWWVMDQSLSVEPLSYFLFQPWLHNWYNKGCAMLQAVVAAGFLSHYLISS